MRYRMTTSFPYERSRKRLHWIPHPRRGTTGSHLWGSDPDRASALSHIFLCTRFHPNDNINTQTNDPTTTPIMITVRSHRLAPPRSLPNHLLVSTFGPPSPVSSASDSPKITPAPPMSTSTVSEFRQQFPTMTSVTYCLQHDPKDVSRNYFNH